MSSWYLDLSSEVFTLITSVWLLEALSHLCGLVHSQEPEVAVIDVHGGPQVADVRLGHATLLITWCGCHGSGDGHHRVEDDWRDLQAVVR